MVSQFQAIDVHQEAKTAVLVLEHEGRCENS